MGWTWRSRRAQIHTMFWKIFFVCNEKVCIFHHFPSHCWITCKDREVKAIPKPRNVLQDERPYGELSWSFCCCQPLWCWVDEVFAPQGIRWMKPVWISQVSGTVWAAPWNHCRMKDEKLGYPSPWCSQNLVLAISLTSPWRRKGFYISDLRAGRSSPTNRSGPAVFGTKPRVVRWRIPKKLHFF